MDISARARSWPCSASRPAWIGQAGELRARIGQLKGQITEAEIEQTRLDTTRLEEAISESRELGFRELEQKERRSSLTERLSRLEIRSPRSGVVLDSTVHTLKSVVRPADPIMYVVPNDTDLVVDARVDPTDVDQIHVGQDAILRMSALNSRTTPEIFGEVVTISADVIHGRADGHQLLQDRGAAEAGRDREAGRTRNWSPECRPRSTCRPASARRWPTWSSRSRTTSTGRCAKN